MRNCIFGLLFLMMAAPACDDGTAAPPVDYAPLLASLTDDVVLPAMSNAATTADALDSALLALEASPAPATLTAAQSAWRTARAGYRNLDALYFGPVTTQGIGERVDAYPADDATIEWPGQRQYDHRRHVDRRPGRPRQRLFGNRIPALFDDGHERHCRANRRSELPLVHAGAGHGRRSGVVGAQPGWPWDPTQGGYATQVKTAGAGSTRYPRQLTAVDDFVGGVSYALELVVGVRLAEPLGRKGSGTPDPTQDPTRASDSAVADMTATLAGVQNLYGDNGKGFTARVTIASAPLNTEAMSQATTCGHAVTIMPLPFASAVVNQTSLVTARPVPSCDTWKTTWDTGVTAVHLGRRSIRIMMEIRIDFRLSTFERLKD